MRTLPYLPATMRAFPPSDINIYLHHCDYASLNRAQQVVNVLVAAGLATSQRTTRSYIHSSFSFTLHKDFGGKVVSLTNCQKIHDSETRNLLAKHPALKPLVVVLKAYLRQRGQLGGENGVSSYAVLKLCERFLEVGSFPSFRSLKFFLRLFRDVVVGSLTSGAL